MKHAADQSSIFGQDIKNAVDLTRFLQVNHAEVFRRHTSTEAINRRFFHFFPVGTFLLEHHLFASISEVLKNHCFAVKGPQTRDGGVLLWKRETSCTCSNCLSGLFEQCTQQQHHCAWVSAELQIKRLVPNVTVTPAHLHTRAANIESQLRHLRSVSSQTFFGTAFIDASIRHPTFVLFSTGLKMHDVSIQCFVLPVKEADNNTPNNTTFLYPKKLCNKSQSKCGCDGFHPSLMKYQNIVSILVDNIDTAGAKLQHQVSEVNNKTDDPKYAVWDYMKSKRNACLDFYHAQIFEYFRHYNIESSLDII